MAELYRKVRWWVVAWLARRLPTCREMTELLSEAMDRRLPLRRRIAIKLHRLICVWCERYWRHLRFLREATRYRSEHEIESSPPVSLPPEARERMKRALRGSSSEWR